MEPDFCSHVLAEAWETLAQIRPGSGELSLTEREFVTAVSTDGTSLRALLRLPAALWADEHRDLLPEIEAAMKASPALHDIRVSLKVYRAPTRPRAARTGMSGHDRCLQAARSKLSALGWEISGTEHDASATGPVVGRFDIVRVILEARVRQPVSCGAPAAR